MFIARERWIFYGNRAREARGRLAGIRTIVKIQPICPEPPDFVYALHLGVLSRTNEKMCKKCLKKPNKKQTVMKQERKWNII